MEPTKHHFLPVFYLKRWAQDDRKVVEFSKPYKNIVKPKRVHPGATGYISKLYATEGVPEELAQAIERDFLSPVDSRAADALTIMLNGNDLSPNQRLAWSNFLATLLSRMPKDIETLKVAFQELYGALIPNIEKIYKAHRPKYDQREFDKITQNFLKSSGAKIMDDVRDIMSSDKITDPIMAMEWSIISLDSANNELLTSDRPAIYTNMLVRPDSHIVIPVGPRRLFVAAHDQKLIADIIAAGEDEIANTVNSITVGAADRLVYSTRDDQLRFVQNRMGTARIPSLADRMLDMLKGLSTLMTNAFEEKLTSRVIESQAETSERG